MERQRSGRTWLWNDVFAYLLCVCVSPSVKDWVVPDLISHEVYTDHTKFCFRPTSTQRALLVYPLERTPTPYAHMRRPGMLACACSAQNFLTVQTCLPSKLSWDRLCEELFRPTSTQRALLVSPLGTNPHSVCTHEAALHAGMSVFCTKSRDSLNLSAIRTAIGSPG